MRSFTLSICAATARVPAVGSFALVLLPSLGLFTLVLVVLPGLFVLLLVIVLVQVFPATIPLPQQR